MDPLMIALIAGAALVIGLGVGFVGYKGWEAARLGSTRERAQGLLREAELEREKTLKEAEAQAKELALQSRTEAEREAKGRREELLRVEKRLRQKEDNIERKNDLLEKRDADLKRREQQLAGREAQLVQDGQRVEQTLSAVQLRLEEVSGLSREEARRRLIASLEETARKDAAIAVRQIEDEARAQAEERARTIVSMTMQRLAGEYVAEKTVSVVELPSDEMKGRIIGREGRNIRALEAATGVDVVIDDTPEAVILSSFNPIRREIAKMALERLISDGRIHPARIEELVAKATNELNQLIVKAGEQATFELGLHGIHAELIRYLGRLKFRTTNGQNQWQHAIETGFIAGMLAGELGLKVKTARRAGLLHDIGKAVDHEIEGSHSQVGAEILKRYGERPEVIQAVRCHHGEVEPTSTLDVIVQAANELSKSRPGARREVLEGYIKRLEDLEKLTAGFPGVTQAYAIQAGREVRLMVDAEQVSDEAMYALSKDIAKKVEEELSYPGQIKITMIREARAVELAK